MYKINKWAAVPAIATLLISGCGGSNSSSEMSSLPSIPVFAAAGSGHFTQEELAIILAQSDDLSTVISDGSLVSSAPSVALATFNGVMVAETNASAAIGKMTLDADFTNSVISGRVDDILAGPLGSDSPEEMQGILSLQNGIISGDGFDADLTGSITGVQGTTSVDATMEGVFFETQGRVIAGGEVLGQMTAPDATVSSLTGDFLATTE